MFKKLKKKKLDFEVVLNEVISNSQKNPTKTYCLVQFHRKDKKLIPICAEIEKDAIKLGKTYYYTDTKRIYETKVQRGKQKHIVPVVDVFEGITVSFTPYEDIDSREFSELFQDVISLHIEKGILENKKKMQVNLRKAIAIGLIAIVGIIIFGKMFFGA